MNRFFRTTWRRLFEEGRFKKFLAYAALEVFLVVVGILIALQVNNWNESRKRHQKELVTLHELKADLEINIGAIDFCIEYDKGVVSSLDIILEHLDKKLPYSETLEKHFPKIIEWCAYDFIGSTYETMKFTQGLDLISNDSLRKELAYIHESLVPFARGNIESDEATLNQEITLGMFSSLFSVSNDLDSAIPLDYEALQANEQLKTVLRITKTRRLWSLETDQEIRDHIAGILTQINDSLGTDTR